MLESDVIIVDGISDSEYNSLIEECVKYAIISLPFTVDRMSIPNEKQRALNIAKGKIAEALFETFCKKNNIIIDFDVCTTPFWTVDNRDFVLNRNEWDIKNNFIYCQDEHFNGNYIDLPALVPNRFTGDQWSKRNENLIAGTNGVFFLFTFLKNADLINGQRGNEFLEIDISSNQQAFIRELYQRYRGLPQPAEPYASQWFWENMSTRGNNNYFRLNSKPHLIITGYANETHWRLFENTGPYDRDNNFQTHINPRWYLKSQKGSCNFLSGTLWTTITNATTPISNLPSFTSLFPSLKSSLNVASFKG